MCDKCERLPYSSSTHTVSYANAESHYVTVLIMLMKQRAAYASRRVGQAMTQLTVTWQGQEELCMGKSMESGWKQTHNSSNSAQTCTYVCTVHTHKVPNLFPGNGNDFYWRPPVLRQQSADDMWWLIGDGCCHLVASPLGWRRRRGGKESKNYLRRVQKMWNSRNKMSELGIANRRRSVYVVVCLFCGSTAGVNVRRGGASVPPPCFR